MVEPFVGALVVCPPGSLSDTAPALFRAAAAPTRCLAPPLPVGRSPGLSPAPVPVGAARPRGSRSSALVTLGLYRCGAI